MRVSAYSIARKTDMVTEVDSVEYDKSTLVMFFKRNGTVLFTRKISNCVAENLLETAMETGRIHIGSVTEP